MKTLWIFAVAVGLVMFSYAAYAADLRSESTIVPFREVQNADQPSHQRVSCNEWADAVKQADARIFPDPLSQWLARNEAYAVCMHGWEAVAMSYWPSGLEDSHRQQAALMTPPRSAVQDYYTTTGPAYAAPATTPQFVER
jgi:hypothetical protein